MNSIKSTIGSAALGSLLALFVACFLDMWWYWQPTADTPVRPSVPVYSIGSVWEALRAHPDDSAALNDFLQGHRANTETAVDVLLIGAGLGCLLQVLVSKQQDVSGSMAREETPV